MHCQPEGLWYKFKLLHTKKINTGDPHHPHEIHHAKDIMKQIEEKMDAAIDIDNEELGIHDPFMRTSSQDQMKPESEVSRIKPCFSGMTAIVHQQR